MAHNGDVESKPTATDFLLEEYKGLLDLNKAREERFDRLLTLFLSLAGAPWALYALIVKDTGNFSLSAMPPLVAVVFVGAGVLGFPVVVMAIQTKFTVTMYARATNSIRGYFAKASGQSISPALRLPTKANVPPYVESGSYNFYGALAMAMINSVYLSFGLLQMRRVFSLLAWVAFPIGTVWFIWHGWYYIHQARGRASRDSGDEITFKESALNIEPRQFHKTAGND
jgi:hypothetical protein